MIHPLRKIKKEQNLLFTLETHAIGSQYDKYATCLYHAENRDCIFPLNFPKRNAIEGFFYNLDKFTDPNSKDFIAFMRYENNRIKPTNGYKEHYDNTRDIPCYIDYINISEYDKEEPRAEKKLIRFLTSQTKIAKEIVTDKIVGLVLSTDYYQLHEYGLNHKMGIVDILYRVQYMEMNKLKFVKTVEPKKGIYYAI